MADRPAAPGRREANRGQADGDWDRGLTPGRAAVVGQDDDAAFAHGDQPLPGAGDVEKRRLGRAADRHRGAVERIGDRECGRGRTEADGGDHRRAEQADGISHDLVLPWMKGLTAERHAPRPSVLRRISEFPRPPSTRA